jgi:hypothetical protein
MDFLTLENGIFAALAFYVIDRLLKIIAEKKKNGSGGETASKNDSRDRILTTRNIVADVQERQKNMMSPIFMSHGKIDDIHEVVTAKGTGGAPMIYNPDLHTAITNLTVAIKDLKK